MATQVGGLEKVSAVTSEIQVLVQSVKAMVEKKIGRPLSVFHGISYCSQLVSGTNYFVKVVIGHGDEYIHLRVFEPLPVDDAKPALNSYETGKKLFDEIKYF